jgi:hypothetical protein
MTSYNMLGNSAINVAGEPIDMPRKPLKIQTAPSYQSFSKPLRPGAPGTNHQSRSLTVPSDTGRRNLNIGGKSKQSYGQNPRARESTGSVTSIESAATPELECHTPEQLSPVAESPVQRSLGRSPVTYPKIQGRRSPEQSEPSSPNSKRPSPEPNNRREEEVNRAHLQKFKVLNDDLRFLSRPGIAPPPHQIGNPRPQPTVYDGLPSQQRAERTQSEVSDGSVSSQLAHRRGAKLASPLRLVPSQPRATKVNDESTMEPPATPAGMMKLTPKRIGEDLFLT